MSWQIRDRKLEFDRPLVMGVLNVTPDSFSDGGRFLSVEDALVQTERMISEGADIIDIGGESTRPGSHRVSEDDEIARVIPVVAGISQGFDIPISIDTTRSKIAKLAIDAGAHIINDISGLRFDHEIAGVAAKTGAGLVLMHSRGSFEVMHSLPPVDDIFADVCHDFRRSVASARSHGVREDNIVLDVGIGFGKTQAQNLELIAKLGKLKTEFPAFPFLIGASRKSFVGKLLGEASSDERLVGSVAVAAIAAWNGSDILRVHDVKETVDTLKIVRAIQDHL
jgi:dihydropteroate synthase